jgi:transposase
MERKIYTKEFKLGAAKMVVEEKMTSAKVCKDLGISVSALTRWVADYKKNGSGAFPGKGFLAPQDDEVRQLKQQLRRAEMERDLLKKTIVFFAELDKKSMMS